MYFISNMARTNFIRQSSLLYEKRLFIFSFMIVTYCIVKEYVAEEFASRKNVGLFYDFKSLIDTIYSVKYIEQYSTHLLFIKYEKDCIKGDLTNVTIKTRKPFIELDCNNETVRGVLLRMLAFRTGTTVLEDLAECLEDFEGYYHDKHPMYGAYSTLNMYANAYQATLQWNETPVAVTGYWLHKAAVFINRAYEDKLLPMSGSPVYDYPSDLLMPDIAFSVQFDNQINVSETYLRRYQEVLSKINGPVLFQLIPTLSHEKMVSVMMHEVVKRLSKELDTSDFHEDPPKDSLELLVFDPKRVGPSNAATHVRKSFNHLKRGFPRQQKLLTICVLIIVSTTIVNFSVAKHDEEEEEEYKEFDSRKNISLYYNFKAMIKKVYTDEMFEAHQSHFLFIKYEKECIKDDHKQTPNETRKPFIEIECNNNTVRKILLKTLSDRIDALVFDDPAECLEEVEQAYEEEDHPLHGVFRTLSIYANAYQATINWHDKPIIVSRYWNEKVAYFINKAYENLPLPIQGSPIYDYPDDLIVPDVAFNVNYENLHGVSNDYVKRMKEIMTKINNGPLLFEVDTCFAPESMVDYMIYKMTEIASGADVNTTKVEPIKE